jgi:tungstate transport system substrate-binding protein
VALTYERDQEELHVSEGWAKKEGCVFHDHFCLAGPRNDPAGIRGVASIVEAFAHIAAKKAPFHSRSDGSATMWKERGIWQRCHREPWAEGEESNGWYNQSPCIPSEAVAKANSEGAYLLCDRSTLLTQAGKGLASNLTVFLEPADAHHELMNSCYALTSPGAMGQTPEEVRLFLEYIKSPRGQAVIKDFGRGNVGLSLFATIEEEYARAPMLDGVFRGNRWITESDKRRRSFDFLYGD